MRPATVTKRNPNTTTKMPAKRFWYHWVCAPSMGKNVRRTQIIATMRTEPTMTQRMGTSRSMRLEAVDCPAPSARTSFNPARNAEMIVGIVRRR